VGAYCGIINKQLAVTSCPLSRGVCLWKHRATGVCVYTPDELNIDDFCRRVGLNTPHSTEVQEIRNTILDALKKTQD